MITPSFTKIVWGPRQNLVVRARSPQRDRRAKLWIRRLKRAREILTCTETRFQSRWHSSLTENEYVEARAHRDDLNLWLDAILIIDERLQYYQELV